MTLSLLNWFRTVLLFWPVSGTPSTLSLSAGTFAVWRQTSPTSSRRDPPAEQTLNPDLVVNHDPWTTGEVSPNDRHHFLSDSWSQTPVSFTSSPNRGREDSTRSPSVDPHIELPPRSPWHPDQVEGSPGVSFPHQVSLRTPPETHLFPFLPWQERILLSLSVTRSCTRQGSSGPREWSEKLVEGGIGPTSVKGECLQDSDWRVFTLVRASAEVFFPEIFVFTTLWESRLFLQKVFWFLPFIVFVGTTFQVRDKNPAGSTKSCLPSTFSTTTGGQDEVKPGVGAFRDLGTNKPIFVGSHLKQQSTRTRKF